jgi:WD40 repeat protein
MMTKVFPNFKKDIVVNTLTHYIRWLRQEMNYILLDPRNNIVNSVTTTQPLISIPRLKMEDIIRQTTPVPIQFLDDKNTWWRCRSLGGSNNYNSLVMNLTGHNSSVSSVAISVDGKYVVSGSGDKTVKIWDMMSGECMKTLSGHDGDVNSVAISVDGKYVVSGSKDKTVKIWDMMSGECMKILSGHDGDVNSVVISVDGKNVVG